MFWAFLIIVGCSELESGDAPVTLVRAVASVGAIRNCLKVAGGLYSQDKRESAVTQVYTCYEEHFTPLEGLLREHNSRATMSLEYGFGALAVSMGQRNSRAEAQAEQLADRLEAVIDSIAASEQQLGTAVAPEK
jgi:hypothetical protein